MSATNNSRMYKVKPILSMSENIPVPKVMYEMPKIQGDDNIVHQLPLVDFDLLETKQLKILKQICDLKTQIEYLNIATRVSDAKSNSILSGDHKKQFDQEHVNAEFIIFANPLSPPYFILALQKIWKDINFSIKIHYHCSVQKSEITKLFEENLTPSTCSNNKIDVTLIWKNVTEVQLVTKVYDYPLDGEANILRFLTRLIEKYNYENSSETAIIDLLLDLCLQIFYEEPRNTNSIISKFAQYLGKNGWFLNFSQPSIVDVAIWSTIKRTTSSKIPQELMKWHESCEKLFLS